MANMLVILEHLSITDYITILLHCEEIIQRNHEATSSICLSA